MYQRPPARMDDLPGRARRENQIVIPSLPPNLHEGRFGGPEQATEDRLSLAQFLLHAIHAYRHDLFLLLFMKPFELRR